MRHFFLMCNHSFFSGSTLQYTAKGRALAQRASVGLLQAIRCGPDDQQDLVVSAAGGCIGFIFDQSVDVLSNIPS